MERKIVVNFNSIYKILDEIPLTSDNENFVAGYEECKVNVRKILEAMSGEILDG